MTETLTDRRRLLLGATALTAAACAPSGAGAQESRYANSPWRDVTDAEWRRRLSGISYDVLRHEATERPGTSPLNREHRAGTFVCKGCELPLFQSDWKYDSGTGWPSFFRAIETNVGKKSDYALGIPRTEYHCARCLGHQGHVFDDGPRPTGKRWCNNGAALNFRPA